MSDLAKKLSKYSKDAPTVQVYGGDPKDSVAIFYREAKKNKIISDHLTRIANTSGNFQLPVIDRIQRLYAMAKKYSTGWPFKNNEILNKLTVDGTPILARAATALADQMLQMERVKAGKDKDSLKGLGAIEGENA